MGEEPTRLRPDLPNPRVPAASGTVDGRKESGSSGRDEARERPAAEISRLRTEIDATRDELGLYVSELDRRRHEALDLKLQAKRHPALAVGAGVVIVGAVAGAVVMVVRARKRGIVRRKLEAIAPPPPTAAADPDWMLKLFLKAALPVGIAVVTRLLSQGTSRRPPAA